MNGSSPTTHITHIIRRDGTLATFDRSRITNAIYKAAAAVGGHDMALAESLSSEVSRDLEASGGTPSVEEIQDLVEQVLIEHKLARIAKAFILYRDDRARLRRERRERRAEEIVPYRILWQTLVWNVDHDCHTIDGLNRHTRSGSFAALVEAAEQAYDESLRSVAQAILDRRDELRVVIVAGPSSSGKTTTTAKVSARLGAAGLDVVPMNLDNYFFDLRLHVRDETGDYDFETPEALDLGLINEHLAALLAGHEIHMPIYSFKEGRRLEERRPLRLAPGQLLVLDTLHGLYAPLTQSVADSCKFRLYIESMLQLRDAANGWVRWTDLRLLRRMMRDATHRNYDPAQTLAHWHYVRRGELKHIIPHLGQADVHVNSALPYELCVFKRHLNHHFPKFLEMWRDDPRHADALGRARRVAALLEPLEPADDACVPPTSVLREFIGGSAYEAR